METKIDALALARELVKLYDSKKQAGGICGQVLGSETYIIRANGETLLALLDAAYMIAAIDLINERKL